MKALAFVVLSLVSFGLVGCGDGDSSQPNGQMGDERVIEVRGVTGVAGPTGRIRQNDLSKSREWPAKLGL